MDVHWEHHPAHFWLVLAVALVNLGVGLLMSEAARRRGDARLFLVSLALLVSAGFFALHALATPGVVVESKNAGFVIATPIGLLLAAGLALLSSLEWTPSRAGGLMRRQRLVRGSLLALLAGWAAFSVAQVPPLDRPLPEDVATPPLVGFATAGVLLYAIAAARYYELYARRPGVVLVGVVSAFALLAEAMIAVAFSHSWHASWWEWHLLMLFAFGLIAYTARLEWRAEGSTAEIFSDLYLEETRGHGEEASVLFADLQGYTSFTEREGDAAAKAVTDTYFRAAAPVVSAHGGRIDKTIGDALMVVFRDDGHATRAAEAALAFQERMAEIAGQRRGWPRFRAGLNTGVVTFGLVDARGGRAYTVTGDTVNVAARLEGQARAGEVVIGEPTRAALGGRATVEELGALPVKGRERSVAAFLLRALGPVGDERGDSLDREHDEPER
jgi:adenylate cyclase